VSEKASPRPNPRRATAARPLSNCHGLSLTYHGLHRLSLKIPDQQCEGTAGQDCITRSHDRIERASLEHFAPTGARAKSRYRLLGFAARLIEHRSRHGPRLPNANLTFNACCANEYVGVPIASGSGFELSNGRWGFQRQTLVQSSEAMLSLIGEFARFLWVRKKFWLIPIMAMMVAVGGLLVLSQGSVIAPFIYTVF